MASLLCAEWAGRRGGWPPWLSFAALAAIATWLHLFLFFLMPALVAALLLARGHLRRPAAGELRWAAAASALYLALVAALLGRWVLPLLGGLATKVSGEASGVEYFDNHRHLFAIDAALFEQSFRELMMWRGPFLVLIGAAPSSCSCWASPRSTGGGRRAPGWCCFFVILPVPPITWFSWQSGIDFGTRRLIFLLPFLGLAVAAACSRLRRAGAPAGQEAGPASAAAGLAAGLVAALVCAGSATAAYYFGEAKWDLRSVARLIKTRPGRATRSWFSPSTAFRSITPRAWPTATELHRDGVVPPTTSSPPSCRRRLWVFWPPAFVNGRFGDLGGRLDREGAIDIQLGTGYELALLDRGATPAERRAEARGVVEELLAIKGERPYLRSAARRALAGRRQRDDGRAAGEAPTGLSLRGRFPTPLFFFGL